jgi:hypothetical protein
MASCFVVHFGRAICYQQREDLDFLSRLHARFRRSHLQGNSLYPVHLMPIHPRQPCEFDSGSTCGRDLVLTLGGGHCLLTVYLAVNKRFVRVWTGLALRKWLRDG